MKIGFNLGLQDKATNEKGGVATALGRLGLDSAKTKGGKLFWKECKEICFSSFEYDSAIIPTASRKWVDCSQAEARAIFISS